MDVAKGKRDLNLLELQERNYYCFISMVGCSGIWKLMAEDG
jgi:hypothetical protein